MRERAYRDEAENCRALADEFPDRPEGPFLLNIADVYECLAEEQTLITKARFGSHGSIEAVF